MFCSDGESLEQSHTRVCLPLLLSFLPPGLTFSHQLVLEVRRVCAVPRVLAVKRLSHRTRICISSRRIASLRSLSLLCPDG